MSLYTLKDFSYILSFVNECDMVNRPIMSVKCCIIIIALHYLTVASWHYGIYVETDSKGVCSNLVTY